MLPRTADSFPHLHQPYQPWQAVLLAFSYYFNFFMWYLSENVTTASPLSLWSANICQSDSRSSTILFSLDKPSYKARGSRTLPGLSQSSCMARLEPEGSKRRLQHSQELSEHLEGHTVTHIFPSLHSPSAITSRAHKEIWQQAQEAVRERQGRVWGSPQSRDPHQHNWSLFASSTHRGCSSRQVLTLLMSNKIKGNGKTAERRDRFGTDRQVVLQQRISGHHSLCLLCAHPKQLQEKPLG